MFSKIKNLFLYLNKKQKNKFIILQVIVILNSFLEILGVVSIIPFMSVISNKDVIFENDMLSNVYLFFNFTDVNKFIFFLGFVVFFFILVSTISFCKSNFC